MKRCITIVFTFYFVLLSCDAFSQDNSINRLNYLHSTDSLYTHLTNEAFYSFIIQTDTSQLAPYQQAIYFFYRGQVERKLNKYEDALHNYHRALSLPDYEDCYSRHLHAIYFIGYILYNQGKSNEVISFLQVYKDKIEKNNFCTKRIQVDCYNLLAICYKNTYQLDSAQYFQIKALDKVGRTSFMYPMLITNLASIYEKKEYYFYSIPIRKELIDHAQSTCDYTALALQYNAIAIAYLNSNQSNYAISYFKKVDSLASLYNIHMNRANIFAHLGVSYYNLGQLSVSEEYFSKAIDSTTFVQRQVQYCDALLMALEVKVNDMSISEFDALVLQLRNCYNAVKDGNNENPLLLFYKAKGDFTFGRLSPQQYLQSINKALAFFHPESSEYKTIMAEKITLIKQNIHVFNLGKNEIFGLLSHQESNLKNTQNLNVELLHQLENEIRLQDSLFRFEREKSISEINIVKKEKTLLRWQVFSLVGILLLLIWKFFNDQKYIKKITQLSDNLKLFYASLSHDIKGPLQHLKNTLRDAVIPTQKHGNEVQQSFNQIEKLVQLTDKLMEVFDLNSEIIIIEEVPLKDIVEDIVRNELKVFDDSIFIKIDPDFTITGDSALIKLALTNLLKNAVKFTKHKPTKIINIYTHIEDDIPTILIEDNGIGFPKIIKKLFNIIPYKVYHSPNEGSHTGMGLYIVQKIMEKHNGKLVIDSMPNKGTTARLIFSKK